MPTKIEHKIIFKKQKIIFLPIIFEVWILKKKKKNRQFFIYFVYRLRVKVYFYPLTICCFKLSKIFKDDRKKILLFIYILIFILIQY